MSTFRALTAVGLSSLALLATATLPASAADSGDTVVTFQLKAGTLDIAVNGKAPLDSDVAGSTSIRGQLGDSTVTDARGDTVGWTVQASTTDFTGSTGTTSEGVVYDVGEVKQSGDAKLKVQTDVALFPKPQIVLSSVEEQGNNTASWNPTLTVALPSNSLTGDYAGTITTSVI